MNEIREIEGNRIIVDASTICPSPDRCDQRADETFAAYVRRHCLDHLIVPNDFEDEECERNLALNCLYFFHKYVIGNPTLCPHPFWEIHDFVANWSWNPSDLEQNIPMKERTFTLPDADARRQAEYRSYKQLEVPRQCQKTSTASKAYVTQESLRQYFIHGNRYFRVIITSATSTMVVKLLRALRALWGKNQNIKRLFGTTIEVGTGHNKRRERISLLGPRPGAGLNALAFRWVSEAEDTSGMTGFSVAVAGVQTEMTGQRADLYVFDDPATQKNSDTPPKRQRIKDCFAEQIRQLNFNSGRIIVCNTRKHFEDFGGAIREEPLRSRFHTLHRKAEWVDAEGRERLYYERNGLGEETLSRLELDRLRASMTEREYSSEYMNEPIDPARALYKREDFQIIDPYRAPIEIRAGLGHDITQEEESEMARFSPRPVVWAMNHCDPAGKEEQSKDGDESAIVGWRRDRDGNLYVTYIAAGQWPSSRLWDELYAAFCRNRPQKTDYELPASEMHVFSSYAAWHAKKQAELDAEGQGASADIRPWFQSLPKSGKMGRKESLEPWARRKAIFILRDAASPQLIERFIQQFVALGVTDHDDLIDAATRIVPLLNPSEYKPKAAIEQVASDFTPTENGGTSVPFHVLVAMDRPKSDGLLWGQRMVANG